MQTLSDRGEPHTSWEKEYFHRHHRGHLGTGRGPGACSRAPRFGSGRKAVDAFSHPFAWYHWAALASSCSAWPMPKDTRDSRRPFLRAPLHGLAILRQNPRSVHVVLAPFFCMGYFYATRRRKITSIIPYPGHHCAHRPGMLRATTLAGNHRCRGRRGACLGRLLRCLHSDFRPWERRPIPMLPKCRTRSDPWYSMSFVAAKELPGTLVVFMIGQTCMNLEATEESLRPGPQKRAELSRCHPEAEDHQAGSSAVLTAEGGFLVKAYLPDVVVVEASVEMDDILADATLEFKRWLLTNAGRSCGSSAATGSSTRNTASTASQDTAATRKCICRCTETGSRHF